MTPAFNTPQAIADELLRVDQSRRIRIMAARTEARRIWGPLATQRNRIEAAIEHLRSAEAFGACLSGAIERCEDAVAGLQLEIDRQMRDVAVRHRLFCDDDATESFDDVEVDVILPAAEAARRGVR